MATVEKRSPFSLPAFLIPLIIPGSNQRINRLRVSVSAALLCDCSVNALEISLKWALGWRSSHARTDAAARPSFIGPDCFRNAAAAF
jgi:hypothetical protein